ncbi:hypothetical protein OSB04_un000967 [Centaurea solstitialis]|uniref:NB-ARC domain-containing protein n=1 Tax=Centaurea solstitialis TaxID=347529 RepID=A0AA38W330_9ASTR|nr:hypothetical protein OSB04_un000967 [Centaurea solstitialis]
MSEYCHVVQTLVILTFTTKIEFTKEADFIEEIVTNIHRRLGVLLSSPQPLLIGMGYDIEYITTWLIDGSSHTTRLELETSSLIRNGPTTRTLQILLKCTTDILTISGMGGIGKTTLAKYVYRLNCGEFQKMSFIEGISSSIQVHGDVSKYISKIENALAHRKVFLVLDDVDSLEQLVALLGNKCFHPGCKVIITTQDASLTEKYFLDLECLLKGLNDYKSLKLLSLSAFKCNNPREGYKEVSKKLVEYCKGHPLALEVLGKAQRNKDVVVWEDLLDLFVSCVNL